MEGFAQDARYLYFILEYVSGGELLTYLRNAVRFETNQAAYNYIINQVVCCSNCINF